MTRLLLDTHTLLWWLLDSPTLDGHARAVMADSHNDIYVSAISGLEIAIKRSLGKLRAPDYLEETILAEGFQHLPITFQHAERVGHLPYLHRDPFDRILIAQAQIEDMTIVTRDLNIHRYDVSAIEA